jgi:hypothetical protein
MTLINDHVLFPQPCDWAARPEWARQWESGVSTATTGAESRRGLRPEARESLTFLITPADAVAQAEFAEQINAARKSGLACAPAHGHGATLTAPAVGTEVTVTAGRTWRVGEQLFFQAADESYEVRELTAVNLTDDVWTLGFDDALTGTYAAGQLVWPLLFGEFRCDQIGAEMPTCGPARISIAELTAAASAQLGAVTPPGGTGIGSMAIGSTFVVS